MLQGLPVPQYPRLCGLQRRGNRDAPPCLRRGAPLEPDGGAERALQGQLDWGFGEDDEQLIYDENVSDSAEGDHHPIKHFNIGHLQTRQTI